MKEKPSNGLKAKKISNQIFKFNHNRFQFKTGIQNKDNHKS